MTKILLASSSPYRKALLEQLRISFDTASPAIDEKPLPHETAEHLAGRLAQEKAQALSDNYPDHLIIGSDQAADFAGEIVGKPGNRDRAIWQLQRFSGQTVRFFTGLSMHCPKSAHAHTEVVMTEVQFQTLSNTQIERYLTLEQPYDCAGSFKCEGLGISLFEAIRGDDPTALVGLPLIALTRLLSRFDTHPLGA